MPVGCCCRCAMAAAMLAAMLIFSAAMLPCLFSLIFRRRLYLLSPFHLTHIPAAIAATLLSPLRFHDAAVFAIIFGVTLPLFAADTTPLLLMPPLRRCQLSILHFFRCRLRYAASLLRFSLRFDFSIFTRHYAICRFSRRHYLRALFRCCHVIFAMPGAAYSAAMMLLLR